ncbi:PREDICTED: DNA-directed RNA polymerases I and III subunit RPAC2-like [Priapulus caudatus]|uniref:DNA-directed RNA polymerase I subunit D n=1 Tax=Priapulus caudatus TaxID=37621 RepID=A0ABM1E0V8_PRICU|nr:PREDICTED: DNA-directed RNA polymerases I and III subunit RPAC2-like [Priapulus caudatus]
MESEGKKRILEVLQLDDAKDETCRTFVMHGEDHTLGNSLRYMVMKNPVVEFCGYNVPHPSEDKINFRIQTKTQPAVDVLRQGLRDLSGACEHILATFEEAVDKCKKKQNEEVEKMDMEASL